MTEEEKDAYNAALIDVRRMVMGMGNGSGMARKIAGAITELIDGVDDEKSKER